MNGNLLSAPSIVCGVCAGIGAEARTEQCLQTVNEEEYVTFANDKCSDMLVNVYGVCVCVCGECVDVCVSVCESTSSPLFFFSYHETQMWLIL